MAGRIFGIIVLALIGTSCILKVEAFRESKDAYYQVIFQDGDDSDSDASFESGEQYSDSFPGLENGKLKSPKDDSDQSFESEEQAFPGSPPFRSFQQRKQLFRPILPSGNNPPLAPANPRINRNSDSNESDENDGNVHHQPAGSEKFTINVQPGPNYYNNPGLRPGQNTFFGLRPRPGQNSFFNPRPFPGEHFYFASRPRPGFGFGHHGPHRRPGHGRRPCKKHTSPNPLFSTTENSRQGSSTSSSGTGTQPSTNSQVQLSTVTSGSQILTTPTA